MSFVWTPEVVNKLIELHASDFTFREIAAKLGISRCAIAGKAQRLGLPARKWIEDPLAKQERLEAQRQKKNSRRRHSYIKKTPKIKKRLTVISAAVLEQQSLHVTFADLERNQCRFPYGEEPSSFTFCGHPRHELSSYCEGHTALCCGSSK